MRDGAGLEVADVVGRVVHELHVPDAALVRFLEALELLLEEIEAFDVLHDGRLAGGMSRGEIGGVERAREPVLRHHLVDPVEAAEMVFVELAAPGLARDAEHALRVPAEDGRVRHIGEARGGERSGAHAVGEIVVGRRL